MDQLLESLIELNGLVLWGGVIWVLLIGILVLVLLLIGPLKKNGFLTGKTYKDKIVNRPKSKGF
tara:strand:+ start:53 stop:244 length:192 start_codon:yes stop_codon:yes gene_type:complete